MFGSDSRGAATQQMSEDDLKAVLATCQSNSIGGLADTIIQKERLKALRYYNAEPFGNELPFRSKVISTDVRDTIESILPSLLEIFTAGDDVVEFMPVGVNDQILQKQKEEQARQATDYINWIFNQDNDGFQILYTWFKDALLQKNGYVKWWWETKEKVKEESYSGLSDDEMLMLQQNPKLKVVQHTSIPMEGHEPQPGPDGQPIPAPMLHDVKIRITETVKRARVMNLAPEKVSVIRGGVHIDDLAFISHVDLKTVSSLIEEGYDADLIAQIPTGYYDQTEESIERTRKEDGGRSAVNDPADPSMRQVWISEAYVMVDFDGDGIAERRRVCSGGINVDVILANETVEDTPIAVLSPILNPHQFFGMSEAEMVFDVQENKSALQRQMFDNLYLLNNQRTRVDPTNQTAIDDLLMNRPGGLIRAKAGEIEPIPSQSLPQSAFNMLEYMDSVMANRTGVTKYDQGLDADSLNKTASGLHAIMNASQKRQKLITRVFAETGVKRLFKGLLGLVVRNQDSERIIRLRGKFVPMNPADWDDNMDVTINVGLGTGNKDQMLGHLMTIFQIQSQMVQQQGGPSGPLVNVDNLHNTLSKIVENAGLKNPDLYFMPPPTPEQIAQKQQEQANQPPPPPSPEEQKVHGELELEKQKAQDQMGLEKYKFDGEHQLKREDLLLKHGVHPDFKTIPQGFQMPAIEAPQQPQPGMPA